MTTSRFKPLECNRGCGQMVYFDRQSENGYSKNGKMVPLQWDEKEGPTDTGHQCPNSDYNRNRGGPGTSTTTQSREVTPSGMEMVLGNTLDILGKVESLTQKTDAQGRLIYEILNVIKKQTNLDPLNNDGDSQRENPEEGR